MRPVQKLSGNFWRPLAVVLCCFLFLEAASAQQAGINIVVLEGAGAKNISQQLAAKPLAVKVENRAKAPIAGATVTFTAPQTGPSGEFSNELRTIQVMTGTDGLAIAGNFHPNEFGGAFDIQVRASFQGESASAFIKQENVVPGKGHKKLIAALAIGGAAIAAVFASRRGSSTPGTDSSAPGITLGSGSVGAPKP